MAGEIYFDLGSFHRPISTSSKRAQTWFDRGLVWAYGFNHEEAASCFERAIEEDPECAIAYWGLAYAIGPNYNKPWNIFSSAELIASVAKIREVAQLAHHRAANATAVERAIIGTILHRVPDEPELAAKDFARCNRAYSDAMRSVYEVFPEDLEVAALYADAMMNLTPWQLWDLRTGKPSPGALALEAKSVLDTAIPQDGGKKHPGLLHLYIHLLEMSSTPEVALEAANNLRDLVPDSGHLQHMPSHIDILCGDYAQAIVSNSMAIVADSKYVAERGATNLYTMYRAHDIHFRVYAAMFSGQGKIALQSVALLEESIPEILLEMAWRPFADLLESFFGVRTHVLVRFGKWQDIIDLPIPPKVELYCVTTATILYGKGIAYAATNQVEKARRQQKLFKAAVKKVPKSRTLFNNKAVDILAIATAMLDGEIEYRARNHDRAFASLSLAVELCDALPYEEPWGWMQPPRHAYGALLLEQGEVKKAAAVYAADLGLNDTLPRALRHPNNVWALHGYHECLRRLGRVEEVEEVGTQLRAALGKADLVIGASCFCRTSGAGAPSSKASL